VASTTLRKEFEDKVQAATGYRPCWSERLDHGIKGRYLSKEHNDMWRGFLLGYTFLSRQADVAEIYHVVENGVRQTRWRGSIHWPLWVSAELIETQPDFWRQVVEQFSLEYVGHLEPDVLVYRRKL
jgi:hypothetical protein